MVLDEMATLAAVIEACVRSSGKTPMLFGAAHPSWDVYGPALTATLDGDAWSAVSDGIRSRACCGCWLHRMTTVHVSILSLPELQHVLDWLVPAMDAVRPHADLG